MLVMSVAVFGVVYWRTPEVATKGLASSAALLLEIAPRLIAAFVLAGLIQAIVPREIITHWMGRESGMRGIVIGMVLGTLTPGGPMMQFPIISSLYNSGVGIGPLVSYLTAWSLFGFQRMIMWEFPFLGVDVVLVRVIASLPIPIVSGWLSQYLWVKFYMSRLQG
jgi:uncharacterized membrane protein YraQ (UPF0718 family)